MDVQRDIFISFVGFGFVTFIITALVYLIMLIFLRSTGRIVRKNCVNNKCGDQDNEVKFRPPNYGVKFGYFGRTKWWWDD